MPDMLRFITACGPLAGFYCGNISKCGGQPFPYQLTDIIYALEYTDFAQELVGPANYWQDPYNMQRFVSANTHIQQLDNTNYLN